MNYIHPLYSEERQSTLTHSQRLRSFALYVQGELSFIIEFQTLVHSILHSTQKLLFSIRYGLDVTGFQYFTF